MWFDAEEAQRDFDNTLFGYNCWGLAYYSDPEGFRVLSRLRGPKLADYERLVPKTYKAAGALYSSILQRKRWGKQLNGGRWTTETFGEWVAAGNGRTRPTESFTIKEVLKHLTGRSGFSRGTTDVPDRLYDVDHIKGVLKPNLVSSLRIDVDQDKAWKDENEDPIQREVRAENRIASAMGFRYSVFKTGSRGIQAVIPLPAPTPHSLASLILQGTLAAWENRGDRFASPDKNNLIGLMRLPGGVHATAGNLGLWIDPESFMLYDIEHQLGLMSEAFLHPKNSDLSTDLYIKDGRALIKSMRAMGIEKTAVISREQALRVLAEHSDNAIVRALQCGLAEGHTIAEEREAEIQAWRKEHFATRPAIEEAEPEPQFNITPNQEAAKEILESVQELEDLPHSVGNTDPYATAPVGSHEWALRVWHNSYGLGQHWHWINMAGQKGILAARILFGAEGAEQALVNLANRVPTSSETARRERIHTIRALWAKFGLKDYIAWEPSQPRKNTIIDGSIDDEIIEIGSMIVAEMRLKQPKPRWKPALAEQLVQTILIGIRDSKSGSLAASFATISESINARWPDSPTNRQRVAEMVPRVCSGPDSLFPAFRRIKGFRANGEPDEYRCGKGLKGTHFASRMALVAFEQAKRLAESEFGNDDDVVEPTTPNDEIVSDSGISSTDLTLSWEL